MCITLLVCIRLARLNLTWCAFSHHRSNLFRIFVIFIIQNDIGVDNYKTRRFVSKTQHRNLLLSLQYVLKNTKPYQLGRWKIFNVSTKLWSVGCGISEILCFLIFFSIEFLNLYMYVDALRLPVYCTHPYHLYMECNIFAPKELNQNFMLINFLFAYAFFSSVCWGNLMKQLFMQTFSRSLRIPYIAFFYFFRSAIHRSSNGWRMHVQCTFNITSTHI